MGSCASKAGDINEYISAPTTLHYKHQVTLKVSSPNSLFSTPIQSIACTLTSPHKLDSTKYALPSYSYTLSSCILAGMDPLGRGYEKICQDNYFTVQDEGSLLIGVYDGHGKFGKEVTDFCTNFLITDFLQHKTEHREGPPIYLVRVTERCDSALKAQSDFDVTLSGTTQVLALIVEGTLYVANLGDSRALMVTRTPQDSVFDALPDSRLTNLESIRSKRQLNPEAQLSYIKMTRDHTPEDPTESDRVRLCKGRIRQMSREGENFGPYRVWLANENKPGLAMTRSIGDLVASKIGVIHTPTIKSHELDSPEDEYLVIATDGIWDVMEYQEVTNFIDLYSPHCLKKLEKRVAEVRPSTTCIAHLLCEEARLRWLKLVEKENVIVDDICCLIVEFKDDTQSTRLKKMLRQTKSGVISPRLSRGIASMNSDLIDHRMFVMRDAYRASVIDEDDLAPNSYRSN